MFSLWIERVQTAIANLLIFLSYARFRSSCFGVHVRDLCPEVNAVCGRWIVACSGGRRAGPFVPSLLFVKSLATCLIPIEDDKLSLVQIRPFFFGFYQHY